jgi:LPS-assembly lipoprotein
MTNYQYITNTKKLYALFLCVVLLTSVGCGFKLKQAQQFNLAEQDLELNYKNVDPDFINQLKKRLKQSKINFVDKSVNKLHITSYSSSKRAIATNTSNARQSETRITYQVKFSYEKDGKKIIPYGHAQRSKEYINDNSNISGKVGEERLLKKAANLELISLLLRQLQNAQSTAATSHGN